MSEYIRETGSTPDPTETPRETGVAADQAPEAVGVEGEVDETKDEQSDVEPTPQELAAEDSNYEVRGDGSIAQFTTQMVEDGDQEREQASQSYSRERGTNTEGGTS